MKDDIQLVKDALDRVLAGETLGEDVLYALAEIDSDEGREALLEASEKITERFCPRRFDSCSIVNARSGRCSENCKWCAQSAHFNTGCDTYDIVPDDEAMEAARRNAECGVGRISLVASGRAVRGKALDDICGMLARIGRDYPIATCASLGLLDREGLQTLYDAGVRRYHCNLETAPSYFGTLCTTHTQDDKIATINTARSIGFEVCSGGIIGMGESRRQRMELAIKLREIEPVSIPLNILCPIPGTPLQDTPPLSDDDILLAVAYFRFAHPSVQIRFAGGRGRLSRETTVRAMRAGVNGAIVGDLLTTIGSTVARDKEMCAEVGYEF